MSIGTARSSTDAEFQGATQKTMIEELQVAFEKQNCRGHFVATDPSHIHVLVSWRDDRPWQKLPANGLKQSRYRES